jgi:DNA-binding NarL/FixJ family response regulator
LVVVEEDESLFERAIQELERSGRTCLSGWPLDATPGGNAVAFAGQIRSRGDAEAALLAAVRGASIVALVNALDDHPTFIDELNRIARVDIRTVHDAAALLDDDERELLRLIRSGATVPDAARELHLSVRTAQRRLTSARGALGARSTAEAVTIARSRGLC